MGFGWLKGLFALGKAHWKCVRCFTSRKNVLKHTSASALWLTKYIKNLNVSGTYPSYCLDLPQHSDAKIANNIKDCHDFYFVRSIPVEELTTQRKDIEIEEDYLQSLVAKEVMTDDYQTHDRLIPSYSYTYNSRLNIANLRRRLFSGYDTASMVCYANGLMNYWSEKNGDSVTQHMEDMGYSLNAVIYTRVHADGRELTLCSSCSAALSYDRGYYLFYPDTSANEMIISSYMMYRRAKLEPHTSLNGSFYFNGFQTPDGSISTVPSASASPVISLPNKIYTSEVNNPFYFPLSGINTVGTGEILGICSAVRALSEGQFGQFPLYAFSTEGVWALEVSGTGSYSARQPVTRDVCLNSGSITQIDNAVLFATSRGIMLLSGSSSKCISDILDGQQFSASHLPFSEKLEELSGMDFNSFSYSGFKEYIARCSIAYDYLNQRIVVFSPSHSYAYVYSLKSKAWGMTSSCFSATVNSYPDAYVMTHDYRLVNLSEYADSPDGGNASIGVNKDEETGKLTLSGVNSVLVTRPLKLDAPDVLKTVSCIIQRGVFRKGHVTQILYGSRDLINWFPVASSADHYLRGFSGTPYKYFRIFIICALSKDECLYGCSVQYETRFTDNLR